LTLQGSGRKVGSDVTRLGRMTTALHTGLTGPCAALFFLPAPSPYSHRIHPRPRATPLFLQLKPARRRLTRPQLHLPERHRVRR